MAVRVTHVRMTPGGATHEHAASVRWEDQIQGSAGSSTVAEMVSFIEGGNQAYTHEGGLRAEIHVRRPQWSSPFIQTQADGVWSNNLLSLPRF